MNVDKMIEPRTAFGEALIELGRRDERVVVLDADVGTSTQSMGFKAHFPRRFFEVGIAEQNMMGIAAGMATTGIIPFVSTFAVFASQRACDQISTSIAYPRLNVKINGGYAGIPTGSAGATHQSVEDLAIMRAMPHMVVISTADAVETRKAVFAAAAYHGPVYLRTVRCAVPGIFTDAYDFTIGKAVTLAQGDDLCLITEGMMTAKALVAAESLAKTGIHARVIHMPTLKPIDREAIITAADETGGIVTVENHSIIGGLGGAVAEVLSEARPTFLRRLGIDDHFGESGNDEAIFSKYGMNTENIVAACKRFLDEHGRAARRPKSPKRAREVSKSVRKIPEGGSR